ncbi:MAG: hypothetical protein KJ906_00440 [Nanoarchaeota archaeon]|nr:hypothetical protein [Nanoarchaeota archaeon]
MTFTIGISSGIWIKGAKDSENYAGLSKKIYSSIKYGVNFIQLDIQQLTEFLEPNLKAEIEKIQASGYTFGMHGECGAFGTPVSLDSSIEFEYKMVNEQVKRHIKEAAEYKSKYVLFHSSESTPFTTPTRDFKELRLVDPWGRPFDKFLEKNPKILEKAIRNKYFEDIVFRGKLADEIEENTKGRLRQYRIAKKENENIPTENEIRKAIEEELIEQRKKHLTNFVVSGSTFYLPDRISYPMIAMYMEEKRHPLWESFTGGKNFDDIIDKIEIWVPAVAAMYIAGHFEDKNVYGSLKKEIEKNKMLLVFETPMAQLGAEMYMRLSKLKQIYNLVDYVKSDYIGVAIDFEHLLTSNLDPKKEIEELPWDAGKKVRVIHTGAPVAYSQAHMAIDVGSDAQKYIYERLWELKQKRFNDAYIIYERAGEEGIRSSILSLRLIKEFLDRSVPPKELPLEFYGLQDKGPELRRQELTINQHALDPLKGMLTVPEEEHGFFSTQAVKKGKGKEWGEEEYK